MGYITKTSDYWIAPNAVSITLNALGEANRIQGSVASGAVISCYVADVTAGGENGDGLQLDNGRNPKRWPLSLSPTYFNSDTAKYVYAAIPRSASIGSQAVIVFPSEQIDIYGKAERTQTDQETGEAVTDEDGNPVTTEEQVGSTDYFYIYLHGIISAVLTESGTTLRRWTLNPSSNWGTLGTYEDLVTVKDQDWYQYNAATQLVTLLKNLTMKDGTTFLKLFAEETQIKIIEGLQRIVFGSGEGAKPITGVAVSPTDDEATDKIVTPAYLDEFGNTRYLSKVHDDTAAGVITFLKGLLVGNGGRYGIGSSGNATLYDIIFDHVLKSKDAVKGFDHGGKGIYMDALEGLIETDGMNVRGFMRVMELIINRLQLMESDYSFTEGDTVEHIDYEDNGQTLVLTMHQDHENDYTPFYPGDIIYGIVNDLLPRDGSVPDGHTVTRNGSYYHTWMRVKSVDLTKNQLRVSLYQGKRFVGYDETTGAPDYEAIVPGGTNFSPRGTAIASDVTAPMLAEYTAAGGEGYDTMLTVTRHGNVADGLLDGDDPNSRDEHVLESQKGRQQAWVLSTTDQRITQYWRVNAPIVHEENVALCLGMMPGILDSVLPSTRDFSKPALYVSQVFYEYADKIKYPARVNVVDRGTWVPSPKVRYRGFEGTWTPDGSTKQVGTKTYGSLAARYGQQGVVQTVIKDTYIDEPYHYREITKISWLNARLGTADNDDATVEARCYLEEKTDLEISRVWNHGALWECLVDGTTQEPEFGCTDWQFISGGTFSLGFYTDGDDPMPIMGLAVRPANVDETVKPYLLFGQEDVSNIVTAWRWERQSQYEALDEAWGNSERTDADDPTSPLKSQTRTLHLTTADLPAGWEVGGGRVGFKCTATFLMGGEETQIMNNITIV